MNHLRLKLLFALLIAVNTHASSLSDVFEAEDQRLPNSQRLIEALTSGTDGQKQAAIQALGRIQDPSSLTRLGPILQKGSKSQRMAAAVAIGQIGGMSAVNILEQNYSLEKSDKVKASILLGMGYTAQIEAVPLIESHLLNEKSTNTLSAGFHSLGQILVWSDASATQKSLSKPTIELALESIKNKSKASLEAAFALSRVRANVVDIDYSKLKLALLSSMQNREVTGFLIRVLKRSPAAEADSKLLDYAIVGSPSERIEALNALSNRQVTPALLTALEMGMNNSNTSVAVAALQSIATIGEPAKSLSGKISVLLTQSLSTAVQSECLTTLAKLDSAQFHHQIVSYLNSANYFLQASALASLGKNEISSIELNLLLNMHKTNSPRLNAAINGALSQMDPSLADSRVEAVLKRSLASQYSDEVATAADATKALKLKSVLPQLVAALQIEGLHQVNLISALAELGTSAEADSVRGLVASPIKQVSEAAVNALKTLTGEDLSQQIPLNNVVTEKTPTLGMMAYALDREVVMVTRKGQIVIRPLQDAPMTMWKFVSLVESGYYNGTDFMRVVPNFVDQGGQGLESRPMMRDEVSAGRHERGTVGIATAGKDTGDTQFFINLAPNLHLDGHYTRFGFVIKGMEVADQLELGDVILKAYTRKLTVSK